MVRDFQALQLQGAGFPKGKGKTTFIQEATYACETQPSTHPVLVFIRRAKTGKAQG